MYTTKLLQKYFHLYLFQLLFFSCFVSYPLISFSSEDHHHQMSSTGHPSDHGDNEHHHHHVNNDGVVQISRATYSLPEISLVNMKSERTDFLNLVNQEPVILNFIFTTCTAICPTLTATFSQVQEQLVSQNLSVPLISISIDPEQDTPARLTEYAKKYGAGPSWQFFTGDKASIITLQKAFDAYRGNKMNHIPLTFIKTTTNEWIRIDGFASASNIVKEYVKINDK